MAGWLPLANIGTPLVWFGMAYPFLGSVGVAALEEWLLKKWFKDLRPEPRWRPLLVGNVLTTALGLWLVHAATAHESWLFGPRPVETALRVTASLWAVAFVGSVLIEAPFVWVRLGSMARLGRVAQVTLGLHAVSYAAILALFLAFSGSSLGLTAGVAPAASFSESDGWVYYVAPDGKSVRRVRLGGNRDEPTQYRLAGEDTLVSIESVDGKVARLVSAGDYGKAVTVLEKRLGVARQSAKHFSQSSDLSRIDRRGLGYQPGANLAGWDTDKASDLRFGCFNRYWPEMGMSFKDNEPGQGFSLGLSTPFAYWIWSKATVTADGRVVAQWGPQIVVVDIPTRRVAWLADGTSPTVLMDRPPER
jgi:hypothetical protein